MSSRGRGLCSRSSLQFVVFFHLYREQFSLPPHRSLMHVSRAPNLGRKVDGRDLDQHMRLPNIPKASPSSSHDAHALRGHSFGHQNLFNDEFLRHETVEDSRKSRSSPDNLGHIDCAVLGGEFELGKSVREPLALNEGDEELNLEWRLL